MPHSSIGEAADFRDDEPLMADREEPPPSSMETNIVNVDPSLAKKRGVLTVTSGPEAGRLIPVARGAMITFGRSPDCTISFDEASLSREHARVMWVGSEYVVRDDGSRNGTFVNDQRIDRATKLNDGDVLQLGMSTKLRFALMDEKEEEAVRRVYEAAIRDGLTGLFNRKHLEERLHAELAFAIRQNSVPSANFAGLAVIIMDVDYFKKVNDGHGHLAGDAVLKAVAGLVSSRVRPEDLVARYGGEEFVVLCRATSSQQAVLLAERLRQEIEAHPVVFHDKRIAITVSAGVAALGDAGVKPERESLLGTADGRLYRAKEQGRNRVIGG
jgi:two-component system cell cycle response regulator